MKVKLRNREAERDRQGDRVLKEIQKEKHGEIERKIFEKKKDMRNESQRNEYINVYNTCTLRVREKESYREAYLNYYSPHERVILRIAIYHSFPT